MNKRATGRRSKIERRSVRKWEIKQVLYPNETVLVANTRVHLQQNVKEFERTCEKMGLKINVGKSKVLIVKKDQRVICEKVKVSWEDMQEVNKFKI